MPNLLVKIPHASYPGPTRDALFKAITQVASDVEQMGDSTQQQAVTWVVIEELPPGAIRAGGNDVSGRILQCIVQAYIPRGVLTGATQAEYVARLSDAFNASLPAGDARRAIVSTLLLEVPEGQWGAGDAIWRLPELAKVAGFKHLTSLHEKTSPDAQG